MLQSRGDQKTDQISKNCSRTRNIFVQGVSFGLTAGKCIVKVEQQSLSYAHVYVILLFGYILLFI